MSERFTYEDMLIGLNEYSNAVHTRAYLGGVADEQARIIKLLEEQLEAHTLPNGTIYVEFMVIKELIALIKGKAE